MRRWKTWFTCSLAAALIVSMCATAGASGAYTGFTDPKPIDPNSKTMDDTSLTEAGGDGGYGVRMTYIAYVDCQLNIGAYGLAECAAMIVTYAGTDSVRISMYLQRYNSGWSTVKHWAQDYEGTFGEMIKYWYVTSGYTYRVLVYYYAYEGGASEWTSLICQDYY